MNREKLEELAKDWIDLTNDYVQYSGVWKISPNTKVCYSMVDGLLEVNLIGWSPINDNRNKYTVFDLNEPYIKKIDIVDGLIIINDTLAINYLS